MTGKELGEALKALGVSQRGFARLLSSKGDEVSAMTVNRWVRGKHPVPCGVGLAVRMLVELRKVRDQIGALVSA